MPSYRVKFTFYLRTIQWVNLTCRQFIGLKLIGMHPHQMMARCVQELNRSNTVTKYTSMYTYAINHL